MIKKSKNGIEWLEFELFANVKGLVHGVFLRKGGVSTGLHSSLNLGRSVGDDPKNIHENRERIRKCLDLPAIISVKMNHGKEIVRVSSDKEEFSNVDGMITAQKDLGLLITHADCQVGIFYDPKTRALATIHSGWRGNVQNIYGHAVEEMRKQCGTNPADLLVGISPSLGPEAAQFINYEKEFPEEFRKFQIKPYYFDLWALSKEQLLSAGILPSHIEIAQICTFSNPSDYFSYRREKLEGRNATVAALID